MNGKLYLIPVTLGEQEPQQVIPSYNAELINTIRHFICEEGKTARKFLKKLSLTTPLQEMYFYELNEHTGPMDLFDLIKPLQAGNDMGIMSEAGCPGIADPGASLVNLAHQKGIQVVPLVGPSSILLALMASGFNGQNFAFTGYLPKEKTLRIKRIKELEKLAKQQQQTQLLIETPYRNNAMLEDMKASLNPETKLLIACDLTLPNEWIKVKTVKEWNKTTVDLNKRPCIFGIYQ